MQPCYALGGKKHFKKCKVYWIYGGAKTCKRQPLLPFHKLNVTGRLQLTRFSHISRMSALFQPLHLHPRGRFLMGCVCVILQLFVQPADNRYASF